MCNLNPKIKKTGEKLKQELIKQKYVLVVCGPTCAGKSRVAGHMARLWGTDVISVDSMQVYKGMDIGTDKKRGEGFELYMIDLYSPQHYVTAVQFKKICRTVIEENFFHNSSIPILAGGSGLYIRAVMDQLNFAPPRDKQLRENLKEKIEKHGLQKYYNMLQEIDESYSQKIGKNDARRIIRALEVYYLSGKPYSSFQDNWDQRKSVYNSIYIGLDMERQLLYQNIESRVEDMFEKGLVSEVNKLIQDGYEDSYALKQAVGYREVIEFIKGNINLDECKDQVKRNSRRLAKKQLTWFRRDPRINWLRVDNYDNICSLIEEIIKVVGRTIHEPGK